MQNGEDIKVGFGNWFVDIGGKNILLIAILIVALAMLQYADFLEHSYDRGDLQTIIVRQGEIMKDLGRIDTRIEDLDKELKGHESTMERLRGDGRQ